MDAATLIQHLTPCLPLLLKVGEETAKAIGKKVGEDGWQKTKDTATALWERIAPKAHEDPKVMGAAEDVAKAQEALTLVPEEADLKPATDELEDYQRIFARRLQPILDANPELATLAQTTIEQMVRIEGEAGEISQIAKRAGSVRQGVIVEESGKAGNISQEA